jgi:hypothetical protein
MITPQRTFTLPASFRFESTASQLNDIIASVDEALEDLAALPDEAALDSDLINITTCLLGVQAFLQELKEKFDAAGKP